VSAAKLPELAIMAGDPVRIEVQTSNGPLRAALAVPPRPMRLPELAFGFLDLSSKLIDIEAKKCERDGRAISCAKGCGACCRQLVPLSPPEAWLIADLVASMPSARQGEVRAAFDAALVRLSESPLRRLFEGVELRPEDVLPTSIAYFELGIPCPFLVDEACSIHPQRPSICREYLVTSPAENCAVLGRAKIERVPMHVRVSEALSQVTARMLGKEPEVVPLQFALGWAEEHRDEGQRTFDARTLLTTLAEELARPSR
jgi:Fe-S-cluster containining protein